LRKGHLKKRVFGFASVISSLYSLTSQKRGTAVEIKVQNLNGWEADIENRRNVILQAKAIRDRRGGYKSVAKNERQSVLGFRGSQNKKEGR